MTLGSVLDQCMLDAGVVGDEWFPYERIVSIINQSLCTMQKDLITTGSKTWLVTQPVHDMESGFFLSQPVIIIPSSALQREEIPEVPGHPLRFEVSDPFGSGVAFPVSLTVFRDSVLNPYFKRSVLRAVYTALEDRILMLPSTLHSATAIYHRRIPQVQQPEDQVDIPADAIPLLIQKVVEQLLTLKGRSQHEAL